ncbi:hypothetical protein DER45DRAFT_306964 [Fusarium avenaceum]|nr:hypothetical protein DER45DRAFT_306964 [Fusarium avenaceum]
MRWLHLTGNPLNLRTLENLVTNCPYISRKLKLVALAVLLEVDHQCSMKSESRPQIESGTVVRYIGHTSSNSRLYQGDPANDTEPVVFLSTPSLVVPGRYSATPSGRNRYAKTLLEFLYGYEAGSVRQPLFGAPQLQERGESSARTLQVPETWFLLIGPDILISSSELSWQEMVCNNITVDQKALGSASGIYTIRVVNNARMCKYHIVIERDCSFADFVKHAAGLEKESESSADMYNLIDEQQRLIGPHLWLDLITSGDVENHIFGLQKKASEPTSQSNREFLALSAKLLESEKAAHDGSASHQLQITYESQHITKSKDKLALTKVPGKKLEIVSSVESGNNQRALRHLASPVVPGDLGKLPAHHLRDALKPSDSSDVRRSMVRLPVVHESGLETPREERVETFKEPDLHPYTGVTDHDRTSQLSIRRPTSLGTRPNEVRGINPTEDLHRVPLEYGDDLESRMRPSGYIFLPRPDHNSDIDSLDDSVPPSEPDSDNNWHVEADSQYSISEAMSSLQRSSFNSRAASIVEKILIGPWSSF